MSLLVPLVGPSHSCHGRNTPTFPLSCPHLLLLETSHLEQSSEGFKIKSRVLQCQYQTKTVLKTIRGWDLTISKTSTWCYHGKGTYQHRPEFRPRPNTSKLSDLGQRLNKLCNLSNFQFPIWTKKVLTRLCCGLHERQGTSHPETPFSGPQPPVEHVFQSFFYL